MSVKKRGYKAWVQKISIAASDSMSVMANLEKEVFKVFTLVIAHIDRGNRIRIISARKATQNERKSYEESLAERDGEMLTEYDFRKGVCGKYAKRYEVGSNVVVLSPEVAKVFPTSESVNEALRALVRIARKKSWKLFTERKIIRRGQATLFGAGFGMGLG